MAHRANPLVEKHRKTKYCAIGATLNGIYYFCE